MVKAEGLIALATLALLFFMGASVVFGQTASPSPSATSSPTASPSATASPNVPTGAPSTGHGGS